LDKRLTPENADEHYDAITEKWKERGFRPRALFERFRLKVLATTDSPLDSLSHHVTIRESSCKGRIIPTFRPDPVVDDSANFKENIASLGQMTGADTGSWHGYLSALRQRRSEFVALGCKATEHGHTTAATADLDRDSADESTYSRELAPLAGHYPCLRLGPAWWFHDSPEGIMRFRELTTETARFYNTVGFNDDSRSFIWIPARHDVARRVDSSFLARLVVEHQLDEDEAFEVAAELAGGLARKAYRL